MLKDASSGDEEGTLLDMLRVDAEVPPPMAAFAQCRYWTVWLRPREGEGREWKSMKVSSCKEDVAGGIKEHGAG